MTDFLTFLNTADLNTLTKVPGISRQLAGNLIAARPFDFVEDAIHVKGMGKNLLGRMQSYFEEELNVAGSRAMITVEEEAAPAAIEKMQPQPEIPAADTPSFAERLRQAFLNFLWALFKLVITIAVISILGVALYYALPYLNRTFIAPVEQNTARIEGLASQVAASREEIVALQTQLDAANGRIDIIEQTIETQTASLVQLEEMQGALEQQLKERDDEMGRELKRRIMLVRSIEYLSRARLYLSQSNFGLARGDVEAARGLLVQFQSGAPEYQMSALDEIVLRLDMALRNLPEFPVIAVNDVDIAWQMLMSGLPESAAEAIAVPTIQSTATFTATPSPEPIPSTTPTP